MPLETCCCKDCTKREIGCHSKCSDYAIWRQAYDKVKQKYDDAVQERVWDINRTLQRKTNFARSRGIRA